MKEVNGQISDVDAVSKIDEDLYKICSQVKSGELSAAVAAKQLKEYLYSDIGYAKIDYARESRVGSPEIIFGLNKTTEQIAGIVDHMVGRGSNILITHARLEVFDAVAKKHTMARFNETGKIICIEQKPMATTESYIGIIAAGTSDIPVVEEAYETARFLGNAVKKIADVGVAGIHRLFDHLPTIRGAKVLIVIAGMEGALPSVVGGLVDKPIIAVPTSVGYGANFSGLAPLLAMLNSCASGVSVVNIDNGFGAAYQASMINKL
ncbi:MAG: nickel pincer cofactor biosynthesis protein LarB [Pseudomonadota bacterium]